jgi:hypothetical protein
VESLPAGAVSALVTEAIKDFRGGEVGDGKGTRGTS